ncbi:MAG: GerW family sporulation protein [Christensenellaceae bacterium]|jgi:sporulation protein YtfJ|nr:GerW family sporulation protein [Christensenellaceae bacterium]
MAHPIENIMKTTMEQLKEMVDVNTIVGTPILTGNETMILPVSKVSMGFFSGGGEYCRAQAPIKRSGMEADGQGEGSYPFAGTSVAGMTLTPLAFLCVSGGAVKVLPATCNNTIDRAIEMIPESIATIEQAVKNICCKAHKCDSGEQPAGE